ncbi:MAG: hypothetical protein AAGB29_09670 [Planctomycetota bacterium]
MNSFTQTIRDFLPHLTVATLAIAAAFAPSALKSSRPVAEPSALGVHDAHEWLPARLWQDPLLTVDRYREILTAQYTPIPDDESAWRIQLLRPPLLGASGRSIAHQAGEQLPLYVPPPAGFLPNAAEDAILLVTLAGGGFGDDIESRRRTRYAVLSALGTLGFTPEDAEHLGVLGWQTRRDGFLYLCPFEVFHRDDGAAAVSVGPTDRGPRRRIAILWFNGEWLQDEPLKTILELRTSLVNMPTADATENGGIHRDALIRVIGPRTSGQLETMVNEIIEDSAFTAHQDLEQKQISITERIRGGTNEHGQMSKLAIASPWATKRIEDGKQAYISDLNDYRRRNEQPPLLVRVACDDTDMVDALVDELKLRNISPEKNHRVLVVSEWDTLYGRGIMERFKNAWKNHNGETHIELATYQRGLDGFIPGLQAQDNAQRDRASSSQSSSLSGQVSKINREQLALPEGPRQNDYIHRLADLLASESNNPFIGAAPRRIKSVAVLGSDVHDKLLIMQALRQRFPDAQFVTTDLDARFLHDDQLDTTRNLVVASGFGLRLHDQFQQSIPPFRDAYQTAVFLATQMAVEDQLQNNNPASESKYTLTDAQKSFMDRSIDPLLFEIGHGVAVPLKTEQSASVVPDTGTHHPSPRPAFSFVYWAGWFFFMAFCSMLLLLRFHIGLREYYLYKPKLSKISVLGLILVVCLGWVWLMSWDSARPGGEPAMLQAGVSIWPTTTIRFVACGLACFFLFRVHQHFNRSWQKLCKDFDIKTKRHRSIGIDQEQGTNMTSWRITNLARQMRQWINDGWHDLTELSSVSHQTHAETGWRRVWDVALHVLIGRGVRTDAFLETVDGHDRLDVDKIAWRFLWLNGFINRYLRTISLVVVFGAFASLLYWIWEPSTIPARGGLASRLGSTAWWFAVIPFSILAVWMLDVVQTTAWFSRQLAGTTTNWSEKVVNENVQVHGIGAEYVREWLDVKFIARLTELAGSFIMYPAIIFLLLLIARSTYFDRWSLTVPLAVFLSAYFAALVYAAWKTRQAAIMARDQALGRVEKLGRQDPGMSDVTVDNKTKQLPAQKPLTRENDKQLALARNDILSVREGAYLWLMRGPAVVALLWAVGGYSTLTLLEFFATG